MDRTDEGGSLGLEELGDAGLGEDGGACVGLYGAVAPELVSVGRGHREVWLGTTCPMVAAGILGDDGVRRGELDEAPVNRGSDEGGRDGGSGSCGSWRRATALGDSAQGGGADCVSGGGWQRCGEAG